MGQRGFAFGMNERGHGHPVQTEKGVGTGRRDCREIGARVLEQAGNSIWLRHLRNAWDKESGEEQNGSWGQANRDCLHETNHRD